MKILIASNFAKTSVLITKITNLIKATKDYELVFLIDANKNIFQISYQVAQMVTERKVDCAIIIDDYAVGSFLTVSKFKNVIAAQLFNSYSAQFTIKHNNANIICFGTAISGNWQILHLINIALNTKFDGGRHVSRTDMLKCMLTHNKT